MGTSSTTESVQAAVSLAMHREEERYLQSEAEESTESTFVTPRDHVEGPFFDGMFGSIDALAEAAKSETDRANELVMLAHITHKHRISAQNSHVLRGLFAPKADSSTGTPSDLAHSHPGSLFVSLQNTRPYQENSAILATDTFHADTSADLSRPTTVATNASLGRSRTPTPMQMVRTDATGRVLALGKASTADQNLRKEQRRWAIRRQVQQALQLDSPKAPTTTGHESVSSPLSHITRPRRRMQYSYSEPVLPRREQETPTQPSRRRKPLPLDVAEGKGALSRTWGFQYLSSPMGQSRKSGQRLSPAPIDTARHSSGRETAASPLHRSERPPSLAIPRQTALSSVAPRIAGGYAHPAGPALKRDVEQQGVDRQVVRSLQARYAHLQDAFAPPRRSHPGLASPQSAAQSASHHLLPLSNISAQSPRSLSTSGSPQQPQNWLTPSRLKSQ
jgi:hypothetical protein